MADEVLSMSTSNSKLKHDLGGRPRTFFALVRSDSLL